ncbi:hypothetical protein [Synechococcus sp. MIT S9451]|uniref:hypothetical protein n=1 Tax=Synechococcus sp. MIT S9451 TaxID=3082543 RepID=UPI0039B5DBF2
MGDAKLAEHFRWRGQDFPQGYLCCHVAAYAHVAINGWHPLYVHVDFDGEINRGVSTTAAFRVDTRPAVTADVSVMALLRQSKSSDILFIAFTVSKNLRAYEPRIAGSVLINGNRTEAERDKHRGSGLEISLQVLHSIDSSECIMFVNRAGRIPPAGGYF